MIKKNSKNAGTIKLYSTNNHHCSYLHNKTATTLFVDPEAEVNQQIYTLLAADGFWRSGSYLFKPDCQNCNACIPIRLPLKQYQLSANEKRCLRKNRDIQIQESSKINEQELYQLYRKYIHKRHISGDMFPATTEQFAHFLSDYIHSSRIVSFTLDGKLICASIMDELEDAYMAIYTFFDPDITRRSLGHFAILWQILFAQMQLKDYLYLGYWIKDCKKMVYKSRYKPCQIHINNQWTTLT